MTDYSFLANAHPAYIESLYKQFRENPESLDSSWYMFFKGFDFASQENGNGSTKTAPDTLDDEAFRKELAVRSLIYGYRHRGHLLSTTNPIRKRKDRHPFLDLEHFGLGDNDLETVFRAGDAIGLKNATLRQIRERLIALYCGNIGFEHVHIEDRDRRLWLREKIEKRTLAPGYGFSMEKKTRILEKLNQAVIFESFLHRKFVGQKRFSLEGGETTIAALDAIINKSAELSAEELVFGMAHRGRLNVLANIMQKTYEQIFTEFEGTAIPDLSFGDGDVKYHLGYSSQAPAANGKLVHLKLAPNPSHLEAVNPVVLGFARAKADILYKGDFSRIIPVLIHGDAALAGQGIVFETEQMSQLDGYKTGGTIHFVINNQIGFTTDFEEARSSTYATGVASIVQAPVFHVNGDDPEAVVFAVELAVEYRQQFHTDVFIDMVCYRRHGHNESDNPEFTQPEMYKTIKNHENPREVYSKVLIERDSLQKELSEQMKVKFESDLQARLDMLQQNRLPYTYQQPEQDWRALTKKTSAADYTESPVTGVKRKQLDVVLKHLRTIPEGFTPVKEINRYLNNLKKMVETGVLDWATAELMSYGTLLTEGKDIRISGQDVQRGTFSHRHALFSDSENYAVYNRLETVAEKQGFFRIYNSLLSEFGVLGFEYGYAMATPNALVIWEAQFGDFANGAQTMIDQFISAGESKWLRMNGLVMLLPHGYEGQGPEHSSARLERFLQLCGNYNMTVANISTPANLFHVMRRQLVRPFRKPLVIMSPKSLLRHPLCVSPIADFEEGTRFREVIDDARAVVKKVKRVLFCTGKVYYDLLERQTAQDRTDVAIVRIEQLYPFPLEQVQAIIAKYKGKEYFWVQEEPANMGAWSYLRTFFAESLPVQCISRNISASPAVGFLKVHKEQQAGIVDRAFG
jgi:2-oxoglutarate dehydrogenase E1 component